MPIPETEIPKNKHEIAVMEPDCRQVLNNSAEILIEIMLVSIDEFEGGCQNETGLELPAILVGKEFEHH